MPSPRSPRSPLSSRAHPLRSAAPRGSLDRGAPARWLAASGAATRRAAIRRVAICCVAARCVATSLVVAGLAGGCASSNAVAPAPTPAGSEAASAAAVPASDVAPPSDVIAPELAPPGQPVSPSPSRGCGHTSPAAGAQVVRAGTLQTPYLLTLPEGYDGSQPVPLVFAFHGRTRSHQSMHDSDASQLAELLGGRYAVAYVKSVGPGFDQPHEQRDNLKIFDALYERLLGDYCVDTEQVFALGHSSGALFSELLACERGPQLRGIAAVAGAMVWPECTGRSAALMVHGEGDKVVSVSRGRAARDRFLAANGCSARTSPGGTAGCVLYAGCEASLPVEWCEHAEPTYQNTNHGWPSFASSEIARFFAGLGRVPHAAGEPLISNERFDAGGEPWQVTFMGAAKGTSSIEHGALCATLDSRGENPWDAQLAYSGLKPQPGRTLVIDYRLWTSAPSDVRVKLGLAAAPYTEYWQENVAASAEPKRVTDRFVLVESPPGALALGFQFAGSYASKVPLTLCIDEVSLTLAPKP
jgi:polyhydroxybutyrate depolymerase